MALKIIHNLRCRVRARLKEAGSEMRIHTVRPLAVLLLAVAAMLPACTSLGYQACADGQRRMTTEHLYFGVDKPDGEVTPEDWRGFLSETVTPRFPQGLSVWQASGQWKSEAGPIIHEDSYVLDIVHEENAIAEQAILDIVTAYKSQFQQEAVLRVKDSACVSF